MAKRTVTLSKGSTTLVTLYSGADTWEEADSAITKSSGLEDFNNVELETVPKLFGKGSYLVSKHFGERDIEIEASLFRPNVIEVYERLQEAYKGEGPITLTLVRGAAITILEAHITSFAWDELSAEEANFTLTAKELDGII